MRNLRIAVAIAALMTVPLLPGCSGDPSSPGGGCISIDQSAGGVQNNQPGELLVHGTFANGSDLSIQLAQNGVLIGNGIPMGGTQVQIGSETWVKFSNIPPGTYDVTWLATCGPNDSPNQVNGPAHVTVQ